MKVRPKIKNGGHKFSKGEYNNVVNIKSENSCDMRFISHYQRVNPSLWIRPLLPQKRIFQAYDLTPDSNMRYGSDIHLLSDIIP